MLSKLKDTGLKITLKYKPNSFCYPSVEYSVLGGYRSLNASYIIARFNQTEEWPSFDSVMKVEKDWLSFVDPDDDECFIFAEAEKFNDVAEGQPFRLNGKIYYRMTREDMEKAVSDPRFVKDEDKKDGD